jgi:SWI/SNF chromatin-remodeling complex subunit SWI1
VFLFLAKLFQVNGNNAWGSILPHFDLPDEFPQMQANGSTSVALMLSQYYMAILFPFEEVYRKNLHDQRGRVSMAGRPGMPAQQFPASTPGAPRPPLGMSNTQQLGMRPTNSNNLIPQGLPGGSIPSNGLAQYSTVHNPPTQHHPSSTSLPIGSIDTHTTMPSELDSLMHAVDSNLLDQDVQGIKRKHDQDDRDIKRARQKTGMLKLYYYISLYLAYCLSRSTRGKFGRKNLSPRVQLTHPSYLT